MDTKEENVEDLGSNWTCFLRRNKYDSFSKSATGILIFATGSKSRLSWSASLEINSSPNTNSLSILEVKLSQGKRVQRRNDQHREYRKLLKLVLRCPIKSLPDCIHYDTMSCLHCGSLKMSGN